MKLGPCEVRLLIAVRRLVHSSLRVVESGVELPAFKWIEYRRNHPGLVRYPFGLTMQSSTSRGPPSFNAIELVTLTLAGFQNTQLWVEGVLLMNGPRVHCPGCTTLSTLLRKESAALPVISSCTMITSGSIDAITVR